MTLINQFASLCLSTVFLSFLIMVLSITLNHVAREWIYKIIQIGIRK